jgi:hyperosmotically inducible protein
LRRRAGRADEVDELKLVICQQVEGQRTFAVYRLHLNEAGMAAFAAPTDDGRRKTRRRRSFCFAEQSRTFDMRTAQLWTAAVTLAIAAGACNRAETSREAREAAADVRSAAARAGDRLADGWLTTRVQAKFFADDDIKARYITVTTRDGVVTLRGFVESEDARQEVLQIVRNTGGVEQVNDQLLIGQSPREGFEPGDDTVATSGPGNLPDAPAEPTVDQDGLVISRIQARYFLDPAIKRRHVDVSSASGVVTLRGQVASDNERAQALLLARTTDGVSRVEDSLTIDASLGQPAPPLGASGNPVVQPAPAPVAPAPATPAPASPGARADVAPSTSGRAGGNTTGPEARSGDAVSTSGASTAGASVEATLKSALSGDPQLKDAKVDISVRDGVVLLQGTVPTQAAKQRILSLARNGDGVMQVIDRISVAGR